MEQDRDKINKIIDNNVKFKKNVEMRLDDAEADCNRCGREYAEEVIKAEPDKVKLQSLMVKFNESKGVVSGIKSIKISLIHYF